MISACFISALCIKMELENKIRGQRRAAPEYASVVDGNTKQLLLLRDEPEVTLEGRAKGSRVDVLLPPVFIESFSSERFHTGGRAEGQRPELQTRTSN